MALNFNLEYSGNYRPSLIVYPELISIYYPQIGKEGVILWLVLAFKAQQNLDIDTEVLAQEAQLSMSEFDEAFARIIQAGLVSLSNKDDGTQSLVIHDPLPAAELMPSLQEETAVTTEENVPAIIEEPVVADPFGDLLRYYESKVGWITPKICDELAKWVDDGLTPAVISKAIDEMMKRADTPRFAYLNAILLAWHKNGWHTLDDLEEVRQKKESLEGAPNAAAYNEPDLDRIRKWKELYPDEYDA